MLASLAESQTISKQRTRHCEWERHAHRSLWRRLTHAWFSLEWDELTKGWLIDVRLVNRTIFMPGKVHKHKHKHRSTHSFYCDEGANLEWGPLAGKTNDRRRNEEQGMRRWRKSRARNKVERKRRKWSGARQRGPACQPARETGAGWIWARMAGMNCPPPDALHLHGWSLPTFESPRPAAGQCAFGEETSYWELWTQNSMCHLRYSRKNSGGVVKQEVHVQLFGGKACTWESEIQLLALSGEQTLTTATQQRSLSTRN